MFSVNHISISVTNRDVSIEFYKKFGFLEYKSWKADDESITIDMLRLNNIFLEIICYNKSTKVSLPEIGIRHFALGVSDIESGKEFVIKNNICSSIDVKVGKLGKPYFFITDPDGIQIEIIEE